MNQTSDNIESRSTGEAASSGETHRDKGHVSLVTRAGIVMSIIVGLALLGMMSTMFVSESLDGDAANINIAGSLRMHSIRLSRALIAQQNQLDINNSADVATEVRLFERQLEQLESGLGIKLEDGKIAPVHSRLAGQWQTITGQIEDSPGQFRTSYEVIDDFVETIDLLVLMLQEQSEAKIRILRIIQSGSMFLILLTAFLSLMQMTKLIVQPMNQLVRAAREAGKGNFSIRTKANRDNEIGVLAHTFNTMSEQLQAMHDRFEQRVQEKTSQLEQSNRSLELLYQTSHNLVRPKRNKDYRNLLQQVEDNLGQGSLTLCLNNQQSRDSINWMSPISNHGLPRFCEGRLGGCKTCLQHTGTEHSFEIEKRGEVFGTLRYVSRGKQVMEQWQSHLLQTIADNIAVAISLDKRRRQDHLIGLQEERAVIARELHDSLAQSLSYLKLQTGLLSKQIEKNASRNSVEATISDIRTGLSDAYRQLRELLTTFRLQIGDASLETALTTTAIEFSQKCDHPVTLDCRIDTSALSPSEQIHILQIVREALSNIQRHANAGQATIVLRDYAERIRVQVADDGIGFQSLNDDGSHHGMSIMRERAESLNASLIIAPRPEGGTLVELEFISSSMLDKRNPDNGFTVNEERP